MNDKENLNEKSPSFISFSFFIFGISCLCSWNAIISCLDFFIYFVSLVYIFHSKMNSLPLLSILKRIPFAIL